MTRQERIERAAEVLEPGLLRADYLNAELRQHHLDEIDRALAAAYPELHGDSPSHWLAPQEATPEMARCARRDARNLREIFAVMRDAYLADKGPA